MFTGIVQGMGKITDIAQPSPDFRTHTVELPPEIADNLQTGASVANNGCCLTITRIDGNKVSFDLMDETLRKTNLGSLKVGDSVNLERAARFGDENRRSCDERPCDGGYPNFPYRIQRVQPYRLV